MPGTVDQLTQKLALLDQQAEDLEASLRATYGSYLEALAKTLRQQLILASYYICTEGYPEDFLKLPLSQRYDLQSKLKAIAQDSRQSLTRLLLDPQPPLPPPPPPFLLGGGNFLPGNAFASAFGIPSNAIAIDISIANENQDDRDEEDEQDETDILEIESLNDLESTLEQIQEHMHHGAFQINDEDPEDDLAELDDEDDEDDEDDDDDREDDESGPSRSHPGDRRKNQRRGMTEADARELQAILAQVAAAISAKEPKTPIDRLTTWQESLERGIQDKLRLASYKTNQALQKATLIPPQVPERALEAASRVDSDANSPVSHVVQMLVETSSSESTQDSKSSPRIPKLTHVIALQIRLGELEFNDPILMRWRSRLRELNNQTQELIREYRKYQRKRSVAEAQDAWRSTWANDE